MPQFRYHRKFAISQRAVLVWLLFMSHPVSSATLHFDAYFAGLKVGAATVNVERGDNDYHIRGEAAARGVAYVFSDWQSKFYAEGRIDAGKSELVRYGYEEQERNKHRILKIESGSIHQIRNGKVRPPRTVLDGLDVLSAFFVEADCWESRLLHTGRHNYWITGRPSKIEGGCLFQVEYDDGDQQKIHIIFGDREGLRVPVKLTTLGVLRGTILLRGRGETPTPTLTD